MFASRLDEFFLYRFHRTNNLVLCLFLTPGTFSFLSFFLPEPHMNFLRHLRLRSAALVANDRWTCSCGFSNFTFRSACFHCRTPNPNANPADAGISFTPEDVQRNQFNYNTFESREPKMSNTPMRAGDWQCQCGAHNFSRRMNCISCGAPKNGKINFNIKPGDWICQKCNSHNFRSRMMCFGCQAPKPQLPSSMARPSQDNSMEAAAPWTCQSCHSINEPSVTSCHVCTADRPAPSAEAVEHTRNPYPNDWSRVVCKSCGHKKPESAEDSNGAAKIPGKNDWVCECGFSNFQFRTSCKLCRKLKPLPSAEERTDTADKLEEETPLHARPTLEQAHTMLTTLTRAVTSGLKEVVHSLSIKQQKLKTILQHLVQFIMKTSGTRPVDVTIPPFYSCGRLSPHEIAKNVKTCEEKRNYFLQHMEHLYANTNPAALWRVIIKYKCQNRISEENAEVMDGYNSLQLTYDGYHQMAYELLFGVSPQEELDSSAEDKEWRKMVFFHHPFLSPANFLLFCKPNRETVSAVVVYAFVAKRLLLFRLRVELECVATVLPCSLVDRATAMSRLLYGKPSSTSPMSNALSQDDIKAFILRILMNLRFARDMPPWMRPYYLCHASRKFMFMCDIHRTGSMSIDTFMKSDAFSELLHIFESDAQEAVVTFPVGCPVEIPLKVVDSMATEDEETRTAVVTAFDGEGNILSDMYTLDLLGCDKKVHVPRSQLYWNSACANFLDMESISVNNWFFFGLVERIYDHFTSLDVDEDGVLTEEEALQYNDASFTKLVIHRVFEVHVPYGGERRVMDFENYLNFVLATEYPTARASMNYIWRILDLDDTVHYIKVDTLRCFCRELARELQARKILTDITSDMIMTEVIDMINPAWHEHVTLQDMIKSGHQGTIFPILLSFRNFSTYDSREQSIRNVPHIQTNNKEES
eukprot:gene10657-7404_t